MSNVNQAFAPLAARMRPVTIEEYSGQSHLLGHDKPLRKMLDAGHCHSMILWGPPGTGKTTLAELIAHYTNATVLRISAVTSGVKDIRAAMDAAEENARYNQRTLLFVDEVHRFNKSQQDAFLPFVESGVVTFIGATTENPSFELNNALLSRVRVYVLKPLEKEALYELVDRALLDAQKGLGQRKLTIAESAKSALVELSGGDARRLLTYLELSADFTNDTEINIGDIEQAVGEKVASYDNKGDTFYDLISAFHKSVRGSDPDAALYWYARILDGGGDALYVGRRLLAIASEDIGNADPRAMQLCINAWDTFHRVGPAEGERAIAQAAVYCALAAKSNAVYMAFSEAKALARKTSDAPVPLHLRNAPTSLMKELGHGDGYRYAHNEPNAFAAGETYFPDGLANTRFYHPNERGLEKALKAKRDYLDSLNAQSPIKR
ncbi:MAG TPA: recombination factor protein RarA [Alteromonas australica]|uniref:Replication-associated recombination protein A n=1 Tax=Alteromonas australica TaxID=589873 RepID=A0A353JJF6_9ALTE|nr:replication-associated recombination protein A [Alteromonas australica]MAF69591.1 recombination factor protein RarA [Alteromonas sp.]MBU33487.1 recombination factor protein RarA [Alteromonas sp.]HAI71575.1 recombination factor protein RarA [Alteromonas australica]HAU26723.1 recombination factor protein RarA [Alteromonas australica]HAW74769.1 recombination factor protein RarA [Alteromonas australica]|tara:strand:- start:660 stop:1967 length:1308 start_codon:yes stop_codon:yes gene_type:complete